MPTMKDVKDAIKAHNLRKEVTFNNSYNLANRLGTMEARSMLNLASYEIHGLMQEKLTLKDVIKWAKNTVSDNLKPTTMKFVVLLRKQVL